MPETALGLSAFRDALREAYGDKYYPDTKLTEDEIRSELGMDDSLYEEVYAENTAQKAHPDTFIAVKVKEGKTDEVKEKLAAYKQRLLADEDFTASKDKICLLYTSFCFFLSTCKFMARKFKVYKRTAGQHCKHNPCLLYTSSPSRTCCASAFSSSPFFRFFPSTAIRHIATITTAKVFTFTSRCLLYTSRCV